MATVTPAALAIEGGSPAVVSADGDLFAWPIIGAEEEAAVLAVLRAGQIDRKSVV